MKSSERKGRFDYDSSSNDERGSGGRIRENKERGDG